jgi:DNA-binding transcriptional LysR family regulator
MDIRGLQYFVAIAERLSFSAAARHLGMAQPPLSLQMKKLEAEIGGSLFYRGRNVRLTPLGLLLLEEARPLLRSALDLNDRVRDAAAGRFGEILLGYTGAMLSEGVTRRLRKFLKKNRGIRLRLQHVSLRETSTPGPWDLLVTDLLEVSKDALLLEQNAVAFALPPKHRLVGHTEISPTDLIGETLLIESPEERLPMEEFVSQLVQREKIPIAIPNHIPAFHERALAVSLGLGIAVCSTADRGLLDAVQIPLAGSPPLFTVAISHPASRATALPTLLEAFRK